MKDDTEGPWSARPSDHITLLDHRWTGDESTFDVFIINTGPAQVLLKYSAAFADDETSDVLLPGNSKFIPHAMSLHVAVEPDSGQGAKGTWRIVRVSYAEKPDAPGQQGQKSK